MELVKKIKSRISSSALYKVNDLKYSIGLKYLDNTLAGSTRILAYHGIDSIGNQKYNTRFISQKKLDGHLKLFKKYFNIVSIRDIINDDIDTRRLNIALTFDDGYRNNLTHALPVLEKYNVPATFCITSITTVDPPILWADLLDIGARHIKKPLHIEGVSYHSSKKYPWSRYTYTGQNGEDLKSTIKANDLHFQKKFVDQLVPLIEWKKWKDYETYWKQLSEVEIRELGRCRNIDIASHGYYHNNLGAIKVKDAVWELSNSKKYLENILQRSVDTIAYPDGSYTEAVLHAAKDQGYKVQLLADQIADENLPFVPDISVTHRMTINPYISAYNQALAIIKGRYH